MSYFFNWTTFKLILDYQTLACIYFQRRIKYYITTQQVILFSYYPFSNEPYKTGVIYVLARVNTLWT